MHVLHASVFSGVSILVHLIIHVGGYSWSPVFSAVSKTNLSIPGEMFVLELSTFDADLFIYKICSSEHRRNQPQRDDVLPYSLPVFSATSLAEKPLPFSWILLPILSQLSRNSTLFVSGYYIFSISAVLHSLSFLFCNLSLKEGPVWSNVVQELSIPIRSTVTSVLTVVPYLLQWTVKQWLSVVSLISTPPVCALQFYM